MIYWITRRSAGVIIEPVHRSRRKGEPSMESSVFVGVDRSLRLSLIGPTNSK